jgi:hypothetical protein
MLGANLKNSATEFHHLDNSKLVNEFITLMCPKEYLIYDMLDPVSTCFSPVHISTFHIRNILLLTIILLHATYITATLLFA